MYLTATEARKRRKKKSPDQLHHQHNINHPRQNTPLPCAILQRLGNRTRRENKTTWGDDDKRREISTITGNVKCNKVQTWPWAPKQCGLALFCDPPARQLAGRQSAGYRFIMQRPIWDWPTWDSQLRGTPSTLSKLGYPEHLRIKKFLRYSKPNPNGSRPTPAVPSRTSCQQKYILYVLAVQVPICTLYMTSPTSASRPSIYHFPITCRLCSLQTQN